jgi:hypothetical protein
MPKPSVHHEATSAFLRHMAMRNILTPIEDISLEDSMRQIAFDRAVLDEICQTRYIYGRSNKIPKSGNLHLAFQYAEKEENHHLFLQMLRVSPFMFHVILHLIKNNKVFQNNAQNAQTPVEYQLAVTLYRMGRYGNAASLEDIARDAGIAKGTVELFTKRCFDAIEDLHDIFLRPVTEEEKEQEKQWIDAQVRMTGSLWREGWIMYDGTIVPLFAKPGLNGDAYFTRKSNYGLNVQVYTLSEFIESYLTFLDIRSETFHRTSRLLTTVMALLALHMIHLHLNIQQPTSIVTGFSRARSLHLLIQHMHSLSALYRYTRCLHLRSQRTLALIRWFHIFASGQSTAWGLSRGDGSVFEGYGFRSIALMIIVKHVAGLLS